MKNHSMILMCFLLGSLSFFLCCGGGSDGGDPDNNVSANEDTDQDSDNPLDPDITGTYAVPQLEISEADQKRSLGEGAEEIEREIEDVSAAGAVQSIRSEMSPVRDQGKRYSASAFAAMALFEMDFPDGYDLSEQCLIYFSGGNDQASAIEFFNFIATHSYFFNESKCPYSNDPSAIPAGLSPSSADFSVTTYGAFFGDPDIESLSEMKTQLDRGRPMALKLWVSSVDWYTEAEVIRHPESDTENLCAQLTACGAHTVVFTGYDDIERVLEFKNSWGTAWKDGGYGKLTYEYFLKNYVSGSDNPLFTAEPGS